MFLWAFLLVGILQVAVCLYVLPGEGRYRGFPVPAWGVAIQLVVGVSISALSLRGILRGEAKFKKPAPTDEEVAAAKAELDRLYLKEHGVLPDYPKEAESDGQEGREPAEKV